MNRLAPLPPSCDDKAAELLARRPHFRRELAAKLAARGYPADEIEAALAKLERLGYLDDRATARSFVASRAGRGPEGRRRLIAELARRGAPAGAIEDALGEADPGAETTAAREAARRWAARGGRGGAPALARHLDRKGFGGQAIRAVLDGLGEAADGFDAELVEESPEPA